MIMVAVTEGSSSIVLGHIVCDDILPFIAVGHSATVLRIVAFLELLDKTLAYG